MASRCINALNELDAISDKIFYKYSKNRFKSEIEGRIKASKSKVERSSSLDRNCAFKTDKRKGSISSFNSQGISSSCSTTKARVTKSAANSKISQPQDKEQKERAKTTSCCRKRANKVPLKGSPQAKDGENKSNTRDIKTPSVYGKHTPGEEKSKPQNWFNFEDGVKMGMIDSFVCDGMKKKALCYTLDTKESKPVPKLLRHRLEVRIGQNGEVRNTDAGPKENDQNDSRNTKTSKPMPLSWEEQLNWENARIKSPRPPLPQQTQDKGLCETHPVIFHPQERPTTVSSTTYDVSHTTAAYRMYLERRLLVSDRGNLTCGGKCITSIELEDARDEKEEEKRLKGLNLTLKTDDLDVDRMDMSTTIRNIENIYPRRSAASEKEILSNSSSRENPDMVENPEMVKNSEIVDNPEIDKSVKLKNQDNSQPKDSDRADKINKRVSFRDQLDISETSDSLRTEDANTDKEREDNVHPSSPLKQRPKSSKERLELSEHENIPKRPYTAPPCSPRLSRDENLKKELARHFNLAPIQVPTSEEVLSDQEDKNVKEEKSLADNGEEDSKLDSDIEVNSSDRNTTEGQPTMRVSVACKSAPIGRATPITEEHISRSLSSMSSRTNKNKYVPPKPVAVFADSSMELPPNLPPAQALVELRKKIREDLAKETADLQLDIQQLYLKHHANS